MKMSVLFNKIKKIWFWIFIFFYNKLIFRQFKQPFSIIKKAFEMFRPDLNMFLYLQGGKVEVGLALYVFFNVHDLLPRPATYIKSSHKSFEINKVMFRPHSNAFIGVWGIPDKNKSGSWHKTDYCIVVSDFFIIGSQRHLEAISAGSDLLAIYSLLPSQHVRCSTWKKLWCASTEACCSGSGSFN